MRDAEGRLSYRCGDASKPLVEETIGDSLRAAAAEVPDRPAVVEGSPGPGPRRRLSYAELSGQAERARALLGRFRPGEHVAVWSGNSLEWILLEYGAALAGLVVTVNPAYQASELSYVLRQSRSAGLFHVAQYRGNRMADIVAEVRADLPDLREVVALEEFDALCAESDPTLVLPTVRPGDRVQIQYTSGTAGTTGFPRCVVAPSRDGRQRTADRRANGRASGRRVGVADAAVPHRRLWYGVLGALSTRATIVYMTVFDPALQLKLIEAEQATVSGGVPTMSIALLGHPDLARSFAAVDYSVGRVNERSTTYRPSAPLRHALSAPQCRPLAPATIRTLHAILSGTLAMAVRYGWITVNPGTDPHGVEDELHHY